MSQAPKFSQGDFVIYKNNGVCRIEQITEIRFGTAPARKYYILRPQGTDGTIYLPTEGGENAPKMNKIPSKDEVDALIRAAEQSPLEWIDNSKVRIATFDRLLSSGDRASILWLLKVLSGKQEGFTACYGTDDVVVLATEEAFSLMAGFSSYTIEDYGNLILQNNTIGATLQTAPNGLVYFEYEATSDATYRYRAYLYKESDAFWMIQFAVEASAFAEYEDEIQAWAASIVFDEE